MIVSLRDDFEILFVVSLDYAFHIHPEGIPKLSIINFQLSIE